MARLLSLGITEHKRKRETSYTLSNRVTHTHTRTHSEHTLSHTTHTHTHTLSHTTHQAGRTHTPSTRSHTRHIRLAGHTLKHHQQNACTQTPNAHLHCISNI